MLEVCPVTAQSIDILPYFLCNSIILAALFRCSASVVCHFFMLEIPEKLNGMLARYLTRVY